MIEIKCPRCDTVLEVTNNKEPVVCQKCLNETGKRFIMVESEETEVINLGDGFFEKKPQKSS